MFCRECGKMIQEGNKFCTGCGTKVQPITIKTNVENINKELIREENKQVEKNSNNVINSSNNVNYNANAFKAKDKNSIGFNILSFFVPIVGLILFLVMREETPKKAKGIGISALVGYVVSMIVSILYVIFVFWLAFSYPATVYENPKMDKEYHQEYDFDYDYEFNGNYNI